MRFPPLLSLIAAYSFMGVVSGLKCPRQYTPASNTGVLSSSSLVLKIRGGAGPLEPMMVAKAATAIVGAQGLVNVMCTEANLKFYGVDTSDDIDLLMCTKVTGFNQLAPTVTAAALLFYGTDVDTAIAYGFFAIHHHVFHWADQRRSPEVWDCELCLQIMFGY